MLVGGPVQRIRDPDGRIWTFEMHPWCGPVVINSATGEPLDRQPSEKSPFWPAVDAWIAQGKLVDQHGLCHWVPPGDKPKLVHLGGRNYAFAGSKLAQSAQAHKERA
ncbi:hypothetical protein CCO03_08480 [Comamonas serinivorans]|uniref:Uncharacterized protein n=2 Tax=Comamonas serinivorans TaxID=1082851 RepID=A0A1Y0EM31_9BURK|nr:hypothetical protein CCO03_08480 [Comamonas serinivorans]